VKTHLNRDLVLILGFLAVVATACFQLGGYWVGFGISLAVAIALTQSWSVLSSLSGYVSLGHAVFYGLGAYIVAVTWGTMHPALSLLLATGVGALLACLIGLPVLRVRGPYFVILTLGVAELVKYAVVAIDAANDTAGRLVLNAPELPSLFWGLIALASLATLLAWAVRRFRLGHGLRAIRENEEAAETIGVPIVRYKLAAFVLSALVPSAVGGVMALRATYFDPAQAFDPMLSFSMIAMAVIGGSDDLKGPVVGALFMTALYEVLWTQAPELYMVVLGVLLCCFVLFAPEGLVGSSRAFFSRRKQERSDTARQHGGAA
jgi:branched-chain amino acid transport system permease protein